MPRVRLRTLMFAVAAVACGLGSRRLFFKKNADQRLALVVGHDTAYAQGFTEEGWLLLRCGMSARDVERIIGYPIGKHTYPNGSERWKFSMSPADTHYWIRTVEFQGGKVSQLHDEFYFD